MNKILVEKVQKLLNLAQSANEHEARLAAEKANELMILHNISIQQVGELSDDEYDSRDIFKGKRMPFEAHWIGGLVREHFFVEFIYRRAAKPRYVDAKYHRPAEMSLVGEKTNIEVASYVFAFLLRKYKECWKAYQLEHEADHSSKGAYYAGLTVGIDEQLAKKRHTIEQDKAMIIVRDPKLEVQVEKFHGEVKDGGDLKFERDHHATISGQEDGKKIQIQRGIVDKTGDKGLKLDHKK